MSSLNYGTDSTSEKLERNPEHAQKVASFELVDGQKNSREARNTSLRKIASTFIDFDCWSSLPKA
ncbi:MAG: hypothetical protein ACOYCA_04140 [Eggerthellaceae bacterium]|jgi:hypothetical protein